MNSGPGLLQADQVQTSHASHSETAVRAGYSRGDAVYTVYIALGKLLEASRGPVIQCLSSSVMQAPFSGAIRKKHINSHR